MKGKERTYEQPSVELLLLGERDFILNSGEDWELPEIPAGGSASSVW